MTGAGPARGNRMILLLIGGIPVTVILAATWLWYFVVRGDLDLVSALGTANRGTLVQPPRQLDAQDLRDAFDVRARMAQREKPRWLMIVPAMGGRCDADCEHSLYMTRQIHLAMGKEFNRLGRVYISDFNAAATRLDAPTLSDGRPAPADFAAFLKSDHNDVQVLTLPASAFQALFPEQASDPSTWYLADPAGWVMMSYNNDVSYKDVIADLKFLLKNAGG